MHLKTTVVLYLATTVLGVACVQAQEQPSGNTQSSPITVPVVKAGSGVTPPPSPRSELVFKAGNGVTPPRTIRHVDPEFSDQARAAHYQGTCVLSVVVGEDGTPRDIKVTQPLGMGLDEKAVEAVRDWRFEPARKDGKPVAVLIGVEVDFHLFGKFDERIAELATKAAGGDVKAELELSSIYLQGDGVPRNETVGLMYLEKAAKRGSPHAQFLIGRYTSEQKSPDYPQAYMWYTLAQRNGEKHSEKALRKLTLKMTPEQIQAGQTLISTYVIPLAR